MRLVPVGADADLGRQRHLERRHAGHQARDFGAHPFSTSASGTSNTSSPCTCMIILAARLPSFLPTMAGRRADSMRRAKAPSGTSGAIAFQPHRGPVLGLSLESACRDTGQTSSSLLSMSCDECLIALAEHLSAASLWWIGRGAGLGH